jgi:hypothetical protein
VTDELRKALRRIPSHLLGDVREKLPDPNNDPHRRHRYATVIVYPQKIQSLHELHEASLAPTIVPTAHLEFETRHYGNFWNHVYIWELKEIAFSSTWPKEAVE